LLATTSFPSPSSWSRDGKTLLYSQADGVKPLRIWMLPVSGSAAGKPAPLHDATAYESGAEFSPDSRWVAYASTESGQMEIYVQPFPGPGAKTRVSTNGGTSSRWARSGREIFYQSATNEGLMSVDVQTVPALRLGLPRELTKTRFGTTWDPTPDGKRFLVEQNAALAAGSVGRRMIEVNDWFEELKRRVPVK
jgi:Tol biopolymer transport system component